MSKLDTSIKLPPEVAKSILPIIEKEIPGDEFSVAKRIRTVDSVSTSSGSVLVDITIVVATSSPACLAIAAIIRQWIKSKSSKKFKIQTKDMMIEAEDLTAKDIVDIFSKYNEISIKEREE